MSGKDEKNESLSLAFPEDTKLNQNRALTLDELTARTLAEENVPFVQSSERIAMDLSLDQLGGGNGSGSGSGSGSNSAIINSGSDWGGYALTSAPLGLTSGSSGLGPGLGLESGFLGLESKELKSELGGKDEKKRESKDEKGKEKEAASLDTEDESIIEDENGPETLEAALGLKNLKITKPPLLEDRSREEIVKFETNDHEIFPVIKKIALESDLLKILLDPSSHEAGVIVPLAVTGAQFAKAIEFATYRYEHPDSGPTDPEQYSESELEALTNNWEGKYCSRFELKNELPLMMIAASFLAFPGLYQLLIAYTHTITAGLSAEAIRDLLGIPNDFIKDPDNNIDEEADVEKEYEWALPV